jgi:spore maturation protein CgeB
MQKHFDGIFVRYRDSFNENFPGVDKNKVYWLPHSIPQDCNDYKLKKKIGALIVGQIRGPYPLRAKMIEEFRGKSYFKQAMRPKEIMNPEDVNKLKAWPIGRDYYKLINSSKITLTSTSSKHYSLMKFFEIPGCKSALCADYIEELGDLGFIPGTNMIEINSKNMVKKVEYMLKNHNRLEDITEAGYEMVHKKHTVDIRANQFLEMIEEVIKKHG